MFKRKSNIEQIKDVAETMFNGLDSITTSKEEKLEHWGSLSRDTMEMIIKEGNQASDRHKTDMVSDSWLSKNIRPLVLIYLVLQFTGSMLVATYRPDTPLPELYINIQKELLFMAISFYFVSRFGQKVVQLGSDAMKTRREKREERKAMKQEAAID